MLGSFSVLIEVDSFDDTVLKVLNRAGDEIDKLDSGITKGEDWIPRLSELYDKARRAALNVDSQLDELLKELESAG